MNSLPTPQILPFWDFREMEAGPCAPGRRQRLTGLQPRTRTRSLQAAGTEGARRFTFAPLGRLPALAGCTAVDRLRRRAQLGAGVPLGLGGRLSPGGAAAVIICAPDRVQGLRPHGKATGARMGKSVLRSRHRHESHAEMFARVTSLVASPYFSTYAVKESRPKSVRIIEPGCARFHMRNKRMCNKR